jgi:O-antigen/teichoic acid export membrane protein
VTISISARIKAIISDQRIATNTVALLFSQVASRVLGIIYLAALARYVGPDGIGKIGTGTSLCGFLVLMVAPGLDALVLRDIAADREKVASYVANGLFIRSILGIIFLLLVWFVAWAVRFPIETTAVVHAYAFVYLLDAMNEILAGVFRAFERMEFDAGSQIVRDSANFLLSLVAIYLHQSLLIIILISVLAQASRFLLLFLLARARYVRRDLKLRLKACRDLLITSLPFGVLLISFSMRFQVGLLILSFNKPASEVGFYAAAQTLLLSLLFLPTALQVAVEPIFSRLYAHAGHVLPQFYQLFYKLFMLIGFPLAIGSFLVGDQIISLVYGGGFEESFGIWRVLGIFFVALPSYANGPLLRMAGKQNVYAKIQSLAVVGYTTMCVLLVPIWGPFGAAIPFIIGEMATFIITTFISHRYMNLPLPWLTIIRVSISTLFMGIVVSLLLSLGVFWLVTVFLIAPAVFICSNVVLHTVDRSDIQLLKTSSTLTDQADPVETTSSP